MNKKNGSSDMLKKGFSLFRKKASYKDLAQRAYSQGEWANALENLQKHCAQNPEDLRSRLKVGELLVRLGRREEAIQELRNVAETYAQEGFLLQAISVNKIILRIDPSLKDVSDRLAQLYTQRSPEARSPQTFPQIPLFSELNAQELQTLVSHVRAKTFKLNDIICHEGEAGDSLMVISQGEVGIFKKTPEGKEAWIRNLKEGDFFGEFGFFTDQRRHAAVKAMTECEILEISREGLHGVIKVHPRVGEVLQEFYKQRVLNLFLSVSPLFSTLNPLEREEVFKRFHLLQVPAETLLFEMGEPPGSLYLIKSGGVEIFFRNREGDKVVLSVLQSGDFFGEIGPLFDNTRAASAKTIQPSELLELTREDLMACLLEFPHIRSALKAITIERLTKMNLEIFSKEDTDEIREAMV